MFQTASHAIDKTSSAMQPHSRVPYHPLVFDDASADVTSTRDVTPHAPPPPVDAPTDDLYERIHDVNPSAAAGEEDHDASR